MYHGELPGIHGHTLRTSALRVTVGVKLANAHKLHDTACVQDTRESLIPMTDFPSAHEAPKMPQVCRCVWILSGPWQLV